MRSGHDGPESAVTIAGIRNWLRHGEGDADLTTRNQTIDMNENSALVSAKLSSSWAKGHSLGVGGEVGRNWSRQVDRQEATGSEPAGNFRFDQTDLVHRTTYAAFGQDDWTITPTFAIYMGLRVEGIRTDVEPVDAPSVVNHSRIWSPIAQLLWKLPGANRSQVRAALARTYKAPTTAQMTTRRIFSLNNSPSEPDQFGNPQLRPEIANGFDVAYEYYWSKDTLLSLSFAHRGIRNYIASTLVERDNRWIETPTNGTRAKTESVELELKAPLNELTALPWPLVLDGSVSRNWSSTDDIPGPFNRLAEQIPLTAAVRGDYRGKAINWGVYFGFQGSSWSRISESQLRYRSARRDTDMYVSWKDGHNGVWRFSVTNWLHQPTFSTVVFNGDEQIVRRTETPSFTRVRLQWETTIR